MPSQRIILGTGLAILLLIGAASTGLDVKSRYDAASAEQALGALKKISDLRPLLHRAESAARGFVLTGDPEFVRECRESSAAILPAFDDLVATVNDNPDETRLLQETKTLVTGQLATADELIRLRTTGDTAAAAALAARVEGRNATETI